MNAVFKSVFAIAVLATLGLQMAAELPTGDEPICEKPDEMPRFPGDKDAVYKFLGENLKYPYDDKMNGEEGLVMVQFIVEKDGSLTDVQTVDEKRTYGSQEMKDEAIRVIKLMPKWLPGKLNEKPVRVLYKMPIRYALSNGKKKKRSR